MGVLCETVRFNSADGAWTVALYGLTQILVGFFAAQ